MNNQISRRNLIKLLGISGVTLPLSGIAKPIEKRIRYINTMNGPHCDINIIESK